MAIEVSTPVAGLFLVLTGEQWPSANEDHLWALAQAWGTAGRRTEDELGPLLVAAVHKIRADFSGKSAIKFADVMGPYVEGPGYVPAAAGQFRDLGEFLSDTGTQVEYVKLISIVTLVELLAEIAWAAVMSGLTGGGSTSLLAARIAIVRFLLRTWWGRLIVRIVQAQLMGIAFQVAMDAIVQAIQMAEGHRDRWDTNATVQAVGVGALGGALSLPFSAMGHLAAEKLTKTVMRMVGRGEQEKVAAAVEKAVLDHAEQIGKTPIEQIAEKVTVSLFTQAEGPLRVRLAAAGTHAVVDAVEEGLHETITEGVYMAAQGQGFTFNPFSFTSGVASSFTHPIGHGIGHLLGSHEVHEIDAGRLPPPDEKAKGDTLGPDRPGIEPPSSLGDSTAEGPVSRPSERLSASPGAAVTTPTAGPERMAPPAAMREEGTRPAAASPGHAATPGVAPVSAVRPGEGNPGEPATAVPAAAEAAPAAATPVTESAGIGSADTRPATTAPPSGSIAQSATDTASLPPADDTTRTPPDGPTAPPQVTASAGAMPPYRQHGLPPAVAAGASVKEAGDLARMTRTDVEGTDRLIVLGEVSPQEAGDTAGRLGVDVVARIDRTGNGDGHGWMIVPANGGSPRQVRNDMAPAALEASPSAPLAVALPSGGLSEPAADRRYLPSGDADLDDAVRDGLLNLPKIPGWTYIGAHGRPGGVMANGRWLSAAESAAALAGLGRKLIAVICHAAAPHDGSAGLAQEWADLAGAEVVAAPGTVNTLPANGDGYATFAAAFLTAGRPVVLTTPDMRFQLFRPFQEPTELGTSITEFAADLSADYVPQTVPAVPAETPAMVQYGTTAAPDVTQAPPAEDAPAPGVGAMPADTTAEDHALAEAWLREDAKRAQSLETAWHPAEVAVPVTEATSSSVTPDERATAPDAATDVPAIAPVRGLPVGLALTGRFGLTGRIGDLDRVTGRLEEVMREAVRQGGHPEQVAELALRRLYESRDAVGEQEWGDWLAHGGDEVAVRLPDGRGYDVKAELVLPGERARETARVLARGNPAEAEGWGLPWDPEADARIASSRSQSVTWNAGASVAHLVSPLTVLSLAGGVSVNAMSTQGHGTTDLSVVQGRRTTPTGGAVWFRYPGAHLEVTVRPNGSGESVSVRSGPMDVKVGVPDSHVPWVARDADGLPRRPDLREPVPLPSAAERSPDVQRRLDDVLWTYTTAPEAIDGLERLRDRVLDRLGPAAVERGSDTWRRVRLFFSERHQLRMYPHQAGVGHASEVFSVRGGEAGVALGFHLLSVRRVDGADVETTLWKQQRQTDLSGLTRSAGGSWDIGPSVTIGPTFQGGKYGLGVTATPAGVGGGVTRGMESDRGATLWQKLSTEGPSVAYELGVRLSARLRTDLSHVVEGEISEPGTAYLRVPLADVPAFEAALGRAGSGSARPAELVTPEDAALVPPAIRNGRGVGPGYVELDGAAREVQARVMRLIGETREKRGLAPLTPMQEHQLHRQIAVDFSLDGINIHGARALGPRGLHRRLTLPDGSSAMVGVTARRGPELLSTGIRADRSVGLIRAMLTSAATTQPLSASLSYGIDGVAKVGLGTLTGGRLDSFGLGLGYHGSRSLVDSLSSSVLSVAGGMPSVEGPSRWFEYGVDFEVAVTLDGPPAERKGPPPIFHPESSGGHDHAVAPGVEAALPAAERLGLAARLWDSVVGLFREAVGLFRNAIGLLTKMAGLLGKVADWFRTVVTPITRTSVVEGGRVTYWIADQLLFASPAAGTAGTAGTDVDVGGAAVSEDPASFSVPKDRRLRLRPTDLLLGLVSPPELARELSSMLGDTSAFPSDELEVMIDRLTDAGQLLALLQRGVDDGTTQTELLRVGSLLGDHHLVVRLSAELQTSATPIPGVVRSGDLAIAEATPSLTSGVQRTRGWSANLQFSLGAKKITGYSTAPAAGFSYGRSRTVGTSRLNKATAGRIRVTGPVDHTHRFANVVFTLEVGHWRNTPFGWMRPRLRDVRRIHVSDALEFLRRLEGPAAPVPIEVPATADSRRLLMSGVPLSMNFPGTDADRTSSHNPLVDAVVDLLRARVPALRSAARGASGSELPLLAEGRLVQPMHQLLSPASLLSMVPRLMSTGLRLTPLGVASDYQILIKGTRQGDFRHEAARGELAVGKYVNFFDWTIESAARSRTPGASLTLPGTTDTDGKVADVDHVLGYTWNRSSTTSGTRTEGDSAFDLVIFKPGSQLYSGELRLTVAVKRIVRPGPVVVNRLLGGLPDRLRAGYHRIDDPTMDETREVTVVQHVAVPDAMFRSSGAMTAEVRPQTVPIHDPGRELPGLFPPGTALRGPGGLRPLHVDPETVRSRGVVLMNLDDPSIGEMYRHVLKELSAPGGSRSPVRFSGPGLLTEWGTGSEEALSDVMSSNFLIAFFDRTLAEQGYQAPPVVRPGGTVTDTHGRLTVKAQLFDAKAMDWVEASHDLEDNRRTRLDTNADRSTTQGFSASEGPTLRAGNLSLHVSPSLSLSRSTSKDAGTVVTAQGLVGVGSFLKRPDQRYLHVRSGVVYTITLESAERRGPIAYGRQIRRFHFRLDDAVALLFHPDQVDALRGALDLAPTVPDRLRSDVEAFGLDQDDLGRLHVLAGRSGETFEQVLSAELGRRRERPASANAGRSGPLDRARAATNSWRQEVERLERQRADVEREIADVDAELERLGPRLYGLHGERFRISVDEPARPDDLAATTRTIDDLEARQKELERRRLLLSAQDGELIRRPADARRSEGDSGRSLEDLRAAARAKTTERPAAVRTAYLVIWKPMGRAARLMEYAPPVGDRTGALLRVPTERLDLLNRSRWRERGDVNMPADGHTPSAGPAEGLIEGDYRHDYPAAYQAKARMFTDAERARILRAEPRAGDVLTDPERAQIDTVVAERMDAHFTAALRHVGITERSMPPNGDCFFESFLDAEAPAEVRARLRAVLQAEPTVQRIRSHIADFVQVDFHRSNSDPSAEPVVAQLFPAHTGDEERQSEYVEDIRRMGSYQNEASDRMPELFSTIFGLPLDLWLPRYRYRIGWPDEAAGVVPVTLIRRREHYYHARTDHQRSPTLTRPAVQPSRTGTAPSSLSDAIYNALSEAPEQS